MSDGRRPAGHPLELCRPLGHGDGVPLTIRLTLVSASTCDVLAGRAIHLWHCDAVGRYSLYTSGVTNQNWLRGVQEADANGVVTFTSIYPGCYPGRWPHIHFEVYASVDDATSAGDPIATSQLAFPADVCDEVYATDGYSASIGNLAQVSPESDNVFGDGSDQQVATVTGSVDEGYTATLAVPV